MPVFYRVEHLKRTWHGLTYSAFSVIMAREKFTTEQVIAAARGTCGILGVIAQKLHCHRDTVENYAERYPTVQKAIETERAILVDIAEGKMVEKVRNGDPWAVGLVLKTLGKNRGYGESVDVNHGNRGDEPLRIEIVRRRVDGDARTA